MTEYRGRIAPSPTGLLHIGHAVTFRRAYERACAAGGKLVLRIEDLDRDRCPREFADAIIEDLHWFGLDWDEGPEIGGPFAPYIQSQRRSRYLEAWEKLRLGGLIYRCKCSRKAGRDFGDFIVWRRDDVPAYQLAVVVDDAAMRISEVVRGKDLLVSTFRQLLLYRALDLLPPRFFHTSLVVDESGKRLAKRHGSLSLRALKENGLAPEELRARYMSKS
jgi:glutamyl-tRNA synthetase